jgi:preprotein translocase subunit SecE
MQWILRLWPFSLFTGSVDVAKQTRQQRRERRAKSQQSKTVQRARARQAAVRPASQPIKSQGGQRHIPGTGSKRFVAESWAELKKVEWPNQSQVVQATTVVLIACVIVGTYLFLADLAFKHLVQNVLLGQ